MKLSSNIRKCIEEIKNCPVISSNDLDKVTVSLYVNTIIPTNNSSNDEFFK